MTETKADEYLTAGEVAKLLKVSPAWVRQHAAGIRKPKIPSTKIGRCVRFRRDALFEFLKSMEKCA